MVKRYVGANGDSPKIAIFFSYETASAVCPQTKILKPAKRIKNPNNQ